MNKIRVGIIGATGLAGEGVLDILVNHPHVEVTVLTSDSSTGKSLSEVLPKFTKVLDLTLSNVNLDQLAQSCDLVFLTKKDPESMKLVKPLLDNNVKIIDLGGEFRLKNYAEYEKWYQHEHLAKDLLEMAVYGLPEHHRDQIKKAKLLANPGCYPTGNILALSPIIKNNLIDPKSITIVSYSGISGAGRTYSPKSANLFVNCNENIRAYSIATHKHIPEIEQGIKLYAQQEAKCTFIPHLSPMDRGIFSTISAQPNGKISTEILIQTLAEAYEKEPFVRVFPNAEKLEISNIKYTNYCDISAKYDERTNRVLLFACVDNLTKGAASQAIQNFNIMYDLPEDTAIKGKI